MRTFVKGLLLATLIGACSSSGNSGDGVIAVTSCAIVCLNAQGGVTETTLDLEQMCVPPDTIPDEITTEILNACQEALNANDSCFAGSECKCQTWIGTTESFCDTI